MSPKVTVLMPVFNRERMVQDAIRSVLEQDFADFELLLVDDGSTDRTPEVLAEWAARDPRVVVVTLPTNLGVGGALNLGLAHARGQYVARHDSDDLMLPGRLAEPAAVLDAKPEVVLVACAFDITDLAGKPIDVWRNDEPHEVMAFLLGFANVLGGAVMFRLAEVREEGGYPLEFPACEDYGLWARLPRRGRIETLPLIGMTHRRHAGQVTPQWSLDAKRSQWTGIMRASLEPYLRRAVSDGELAALITVWRRDGRLGMAKVADAIMREAFARFRDEHPELQARVRKEFLRRWVNAALNFARRRHPIEAVRYLARAARWLT